MTIVDTTWGETEPEDIHHVISVSWNGTTADLPVCCVKGKSASIDNKNEPIYYAEFDYFLGDGQEDADIECIDASWWPQGANRGCSVNEDDVPDAILDAVLSFNPED